MGAAERQAASNLSRGPFLRLRSDDDDDNLELPPVVALGRLVTLIGARSKCHVCVKAADVSRRHALVLHSAGRLFVRDLNSRTGTYRNGQRVRQAYLQDGDVLRIGPAEWEVGGVGDHNDAASRAAGARPFPARVAVEGAGQLALDGPVFLIGRRHGSDLCVRDARVSAAHAAIVDDGEGGWTLVDLVSHEGTGVGALAVESARLNAGDVVRVAGARFRLVLAEQPVPQVEPIPEPAASSKQEQEQEQDQVRDQDQLSLSDVPDEAPSFSDLPSEDYGLNGVAGSGAALRELAAAAAEARARQEQAEPAPAAASPFANDEFDLDALAASDADDDVVLERARADLFEAEPNSPPRPAATPPSPPLVEKPGPRPKVTFSPVVTAGRAADGPTTGVTMALMNPLTLEVVAAPSSARSKAKAAKAAGGKALDPVES